MKKLNVGSFDPNLDQIVIEGIKYSGAMFRTFGCSFPKNIGLTFRIIEVEDGVLTLETVRPDERRRPDHHDVDEYYKEEIPDVPKPHGPIIP